MSVQTPYLLTNERTWLDWYANIKSTALKQRIWEYMDPNSDTPTQLPIEPKEPEYSTYHPQATDYGHLNASQQKLFDHAYHIWEKKAAKVEAILDKYYSMDQHIRSTVAVQHQPLIRDKDSVHDQLKALSSRFATNPYYRIRQLFQRWHTLIKTPHSENLQQWLGEWDSFLVEAKGTGRPGLESKTYDWEPILGFIDAIRPLEPTFAANCEGDLQKNGNLSIQEVITHYRGHLQGAQGLENDLVKASYTTLGGNQPPSQESSDPGKGKGKGKPLTKCICGSMHRFDQCFYIVESRRHPGWQPKSHIEAIVAEKRKNPNLLAKFNDIRKKANLPEWSMQSANSIVNGGSQGVYSAMVSATIPPSNDLQNTVILDSGATTHVCNDRTRFMEFKPTKEWLKHGDTGTWIHGYGKVNIQLIAPNGKETTCITLGETAYCPGFHLNIASFPRFFDRNLFWDTERGMLYHKDHGQRNLARVQKQGNLFILEQGERRISHHSVDVNMKQSSRPLISEAPAEIWHRRLGHIYHGSMAKLPQVIDGIAISGGKNRSDDRCPPCELAKAQHQISRRPANRATRPGERVHLDLIDNTIAYNGRRYCCHFMDDATRLQVIYTLNSRTQEEVMNAILAFVSLVKTQWGFKVAIFKMDGERALGSTFYSFCKKKGIQWTESLPYTPEQNGTAERAGKTMIERARSLIVDSRLPKTLWPEAFNAAVHIINRTPTRVPTDRGGHEWIIPLQRMHALSTGGHIRPNLANLRLYGCRAYVKLPKRDQGSRRNKMAPRAVIGYLVGFVASNIWRIWLPEEKKVVSARDVKFDEKNQYKPDDPFATTIKVPDDEPNLPAQPPPAPILQQPTYSRSQQPAHQQSATPQGVVNQQDKMTQQHQDGPNTAQDLVPQSTSDSAGEIAKEPVLRTLPEQPLLPPPSPRYDPMDLDEDMPDAPNLPAEQSIEQPVEKPSMPQIGDEKMEGVETTGPATPRSQSPSLPNATLSSSTCLD